VKAVKAVAASASAPKRRGRRPNAEKALDLAPPPAETSEQGEI
jgi:hypothetical protein